jgi:hypothetical protein
MFVGTTGHAEATEEAIAGSDIPGSASITNRVDPNGVKSESENAMFGSFVETISPEDPGETELTENEHPETGSPSDVGYSSSLVV